MTLERAVGALGWALGAFGVLVLVATALRVDAAADAPSPKASSRTAYFGLLHLHAPRRLILDHAAVELTAKQIYQFARGEAIAPADGVVSQLSTPLDFIALTNEVAQGAGADRWRAAREALARTSEPGRFSAFMGFESVFDDALDGSRRQVIFQDDRRLALLRAGPSAAAPAQLWRWMDELRARGVESLAVLEGPLSDAALSNGANMGDVLGDERQRLRNEPLLAVDVDAIAATQHASLLSPRWFASAAQAADTPAGFGLVAAGIPHAAAIPGRQAGSGAQGNSELGDREGPVFAASSRLSDAAALRAVLGASGLTGVWAEDNTPQAIYAALRRRETFVTSGSRLKLRMFAGYRFPAEVHGQHGFERIAQRHGVPMGGELGRGRGPVMIAAVATAASSSGGLQRLDVIKAWVHHGRVVEKTFAMARSSAPGCLAGGLQSQGASGDAEHRLAGTWIDPEFDRTTPAFYMVRAAERAACVAVQAGDTTAVIPSASDLMPARGQLALSSPVWFWPQAKRSG